MENPKEGEQSEGHVTEVEDKNAEKGKWINNEEGKKNVLIPIWMI